MIITNVVTYCDRICNSPTLMVELNVVPYFALTLVLVAVFVHKCM